jgi:arsenate reductase (thioredoxin)
MKKKVLLICTGNCCRSPMAEGIWKKLAGNHWEVYSAGSSPTGYLHPLAIQALTAKGIDISQQTSKSISELPVDHFDVAITLCNNARDKLPILPADKILHWPVEV